jgi:hypothetical protein
MNENQHAKVSPEQRFEHHRKTRSLFVCIGKRDNLKFEWFNDPDRGQIVCLRYRNVHDGNGYWNPERGIAKLNPKEADDYNILEGAKVSLERAITQLERDERKLVWEAFHKKFGIIK